MSIISCFPGGSAGGGTGMPEYTYTGNSTLIDDGGGNWRIKFLTSGALRFTKLGSAKGGVDVFCVGGGASGGGIGFGGGGGYTATVTKTVSTGVAYQIVIGAGGAGVAGNASAKGNDGGTTSALGVYANGGQGGKSWNQQGAGEGSGGASGGGASGGKNAQAYVAMAYALTAFPWLAALAAQMAPTAEPPSTGLADSDRGRRRGNSASPQATCTRAAAADGVRPSEPVVMAEAARVMGQAENPIQAAVAEPPTEQPPAREVPGSSSSAITGGEKMNYALIENGVVTNMIWLYSANAGDFPTAVPCGDVPVAIGDTYDGQDFYREGEKVVSTLTAAQKEVETMQADLPMLKAQIQAISDRNDFIEDCIAEMAAVVYGE